LQSFGLDARRHAGLSAIPAARRRSRFGPDLEPNFLQNVELSTTPKAPQTPNPARCRIMKSTTFGPRSAFVTNFTGQFLNSRHAPATSWEAATLKKTL